MRIHTVKHQPLTLEQERKELKAIDPGALDPYEQHFCLGLIQTGRVRQAIRATAQKFGDDVSPQALFKRARELLGREDVRAYLAELRDRLEELGVMSALQLRKFCSDVIATPISEIDETSPLVQEKTVTERYNKDGELVSTKTVLKMVPKAQAAALLAKISGYEAAQEVNVNTGGGLMIVPMVPGEGSEQVDNWERVAARAQKRLMEDARNSAIDADEL